MTGTVVRRKRGKFLADLAHPGDEILVARGGQGGVRTKLCSYLQKVRFNAFGTISDDVCWPSIN